MAQLTQADRVSSELRTDILRGRMRPGDKLPFADLCARYNTSVGVMREGLSRLVAQGLVVNEPQVGFRVIPLSMEDLRQLTEARVYVEGRVLELSILSGGMEWESLLVGAHHALERTPETVPGDVSTMSEEWALAHARFHAVCLQACSNRRMLEVAETLRASAELYRRWSVPLASGHRDVAAEHRRILDAALARDPEAALRALGEHLAHTRELLDPMNADSMTPVVAST
jgi:DNA-binding GntR family transcriptional regulator